MSLWYLDANATVPFSDYALLEELLKGSSNPSSLHQMGQRASLLLEETRERVASIFRADPFDCFFSSGATESINGILQGWCYARQRSGEPSVIRVGATDHSAVLGAAKQCASLGIGKVVIQSVDQDGQLMLSAEVAQLQVVTLANNETGILQDLGKIKKNIQAECYLIDATQAVGKVDITPYLNFFPKDKTAWVWSTHKMGTLPGIAVAVVPMDFPMVNVFVGGKQERSRRPGTENLPGVASLLLRLRQTDDFRKMDWQSVSKVRDQFEGSLRQEFANVIIHGHRVPRLPNTTNFHVPGFRLTVLPFLDSQGFCVSLGSACSSGMVSSSHVIKAMTLDENIAQAPVRVSLGHSMVTGEFVNPLIEALKVYRQQSA